MNTPSLYELQKWMKANIQPGCAKAPGSFLDEEAGLSVYAEGYPARIHEALSEVYEAVLHVMGDRRFLEASHAYARAYPSHDYNLSFTGRHFPDFLERAAFAEWPFLPDLARLEWQISQAFHAFDRPPVDPKHFSSLSLEAWQKAQIVFQPSVSVIASKWPILDIWESRKKKREEIDIDLVRRSQTLMVYRVDVSVRCALLEEKEYSFLKGLLEGQQFGKLCEVCGQTASMGKWASRWIENGLIVRIQEPGSQGDRS